MPALGVLQRPLTAQDEGIACKRLYGRQSASLNVEDRMARRNTIFYAYPFKPPLVGESVAGAIKSIRNHPDIAGKSVRFKLWPDISASGKSLANTIMQNIDRAQVFACDLTYPNNNVSFELGYAIGRFKRVFVSVDTGIEESERRFKRNYFNLIGLGYSPYENYQELANELVNQRPWEDLDQHVLNKRYQQMPARPEFPTLLYVKPGINTSSVFGTVELLRTSLFGNSLVIDDPLDNPSPSLDWYADQLTKADAVIVHLLGNEHIGSSTHNTKGSLIAGLACGLKRPLLMLAHTPYESPVDYGHLLHVHDTAARCKEIVSDWLAEEIKDLPRRRQRRSQEIPRGSLELRHVMLGQWVAEHERESLDNYFVETSAYHRALDEPTTILIGRRGTGKTAILFAIETNLKRSNRNHVTTINPVGYELEGLIRVLKEIRQYSERGFLIESLWKYLIYSEVALSIEEAISGRPIYHPRTPAEEDFLKYCETNAQIIRLPFSVRIENAIRSLGGIGKITEAIQQRARISEGLHDSLLRKLREHIGNVLERYDRLVILIDNLDGPWSPGAHVDQLSELIKGLLDVVQYIPKDFRRSTHGLESIDTQVTVLLRSDIFAFVRPLMAEQDKLPIERVLWTERDQLLNLLNQRLLQNTPTHVSDQDIWNRLFPEDVVGVSPVEFVFRTTLPRPRDVIYMVKTAINNAINRQHDKVLPEDLLDAREQYSEFVFRSVLAEDDPQRNKLQAILYEFAGATRTVTNSDIRQRMLSAKVKVGDSDWYIDLLCDIGFLGIPTKKGFRYSREEGERSMLREISRRLATRSAIEETFEINPAFYQVLQIE